MNILTSTKLFPVLQMTLCTLASVRYLWAGDYRHALYWFFAACLTGTVTF